MAKVQTLRPKADVKVMLPDRLGQWLPPEGQALEVNEYWLRRIADGDVEIVEDKRPAASARATAKKDA
jgi:hypothetical protein